MFEFYSRDSSLLRKFTPQPSSLSLLELNPRISTYSRDLLTIYLREHRISAGDSVLVPDYICNTVVDAILCTGAEVDLYSVDPENLNTVPTSVIDDAITAHTRAVLFVDYFGVPTNVAPTLLQRLREKNILTIRDAAHAFLTLTQKPFRLGEWSAVITSPYKNVPCYVGGLLFSEGLAETPEQAGGVSASTFLKRLAAVNGKKILGSLHPALALKPLNTIEEREREDAPFHSTNKAMRQVWTRVLRHLDLEKIIQDRATLCDQYDEIFSHFPSAIRPLYEKEERQNATLMAYPLIFDCVKSRNTMMDDLRRNGVDAFSWPTFSVRGKNERAWARILLLPLAKDISPKVRRSDVFVRAE